MTAEEVRGAVARHTLWQQTPWDKRGDLWCIHISHPGYQGGVRAVVSTAPDHRPTVLFLGFRTHSLKRGACLGCEWESEDFRTEKEAVEAAHDHAWPGWRNLPAVRQPGSNYERWLDEVKKAYPPGWLEAGGPIVTVRPDSRFSRHLPGKAPFGGYDLAADYYQPKKRWDNHVQPTLELEFPR